jgi:hypothetical protein
LRRLLIFLLVLVVLSLVTGTARYRQPRMRTFHSRAADVLDDPATPKGTADRFRMVETAAKPLAETKIPWSVIWNHGTVTDKVLLIRDPKIVDHCDFQAIRAPTPNNPDNCATTGAWTFGKLLTRAFHKPAPTATEGDVAGWLATWMHPSQTSPQVLKTFADLWTDKTDLSKLPVRLLAIVNRLDLAKIGTDTCGQKLPANNLCHPEVRFVYAAIPSDPTKPFLTFILEFVLPCYPEGQFYQLAKNWSALSSLKEDDYRKTLEERLEGAIESAVKDGDIRLRINGTVDNVDWTFGQYSFQANVLQPEPLDEQSTTQVLTCVGPESLLGEYATSQLGRTEILANRPCMRPEPSFSCVSPKRLATCAAHITTNPPSAVLTLANTIGTGDQDRENLRFPLSIYSCVGCHSWETTAVNPDALKDPFAPFDEIKYREPNHSSKLSNFLAGVNDSSNQPTGEPETGFWEIPKPPLYTGCNPLPKTFPHEYNDLLRRHLFLWVVLSREKDWLTRLPAYIAVQPH